MILRRRRLSPPHTRGSRHFGTSNAYVQLPAIKGMIRYLTGDAGWSRMRPPLVDLTEAERAEFRTRLLTIGATVQED